MNTSELKRAAVDLVKMLLRREGFNPYDNSAHWGWVKRVA